MDRYSFGHVLLIVQALIYIFNGQKNNQHHIRFKNAVDTQQIIKPASNKSKHSHLPDGSVITLDNIADDTLALQGSTNIIRLDDGSILYKAGKSIDTSVTYNTISTPKGRPVPGHITRQHACMVKCRQLTSFSYRI